MLCMCRCGLNEPSVGRCCRCCPDRTIRRLNIFGDRAVITKNLSHSARLMSAGTWTPEHRNSVACQYETTSNDWKHWTQSTGISVTKSFQNCVSTQTNASNGRMNPGTWFWTLRWCEYTQISMVSGTFYEVQAGRRGWGAGSRIILIVEHQPPTHDARYWQRLHWRCNLCACLNVLHTIAARA